MDGLLALYIFMLAAFTGYEIIAKVPVILHTPLMSGSNFLHGVVVVGAMIALGNADTALEQADHLASTLGGQGPLRLRIRHQDHVRVRLAWDPPVGDLRERTAQRDGMPGEP